MIKEYYYFLKNTVKYLSRAVYNVYGEKNRSYEDYLKDPHKYRSVGWDYQDENGNPIFPKHEKLEKLTFEKERSSIHVEENNLTENNEQFLQQIDSENDFDGELQSLIDWEKEKENDD